jgi:hypothetical protein
VSALRDEISYSAGPTAPDGTLRDAYWPTPAAPAAQQQQQYHVDAASYKPSDDDVDDDDDGEEISDDETDDVLRDPAITTTYFATPAEYNKTATALSAAPPPPPAAPTYNPKILQFFTTKLAKDTTFQFNPQAMGLVRGEVLGEGFYGKVSDGTYKKDGMKRRCAIKSLKPVTPGTPVEKVLWHFAQIAYVREARLLRRITKRNPEHVVKLVGAYVGPEGSLELVLDFSLLGSIESIIAKDTFHLNDAQKANLIYQAARGIAELHAVRIVHCDVAARNFLAYFTPDAMEKGIVVKVCDLGLASKVPKGKPGYQITEPRSMPLCESPPESYFRYHTFKSDSYMLGALMHAVFTGTRPHNGVTMEKVYQAMVDGGLKLPVPPQVEKAGLGVLMGRCVSIGNGLKPFTAANLAACINNRPTVKQIVQGLEKFKNAGV